MKKNFFLTLFIFILLFTLISCGWGKTHQINYFVEGEFVGVEIENNKMEFFLNVMPISKEEYSDLDGINVVHDVYKDLYYKLDLFYVEDDGGKNEITLQNFKAYGTPYRYRDDFSNSIMPFISDNNPLEYGSDIYIMELKYKENMEMHSIVYFKYKEENK